MYFIILAGYILHLFLKAFEGIAGNAEKPTQVHFSLPSEYKLSFNPPF